MTYGSGFYGDGVYGTGGPSLSPIGRVVVTATAGNLTSPADALAIARVTVSTTTGTVPAPTEALGRVEVFADVRPLDIGGTADPVPAGRSRGLAKVKAFAYPRPDLIDGRVA